jgi:hypothetical protein
METFTKGDKVQFANGEDLKEGIVWLVGKQEGLDMLIIQDKIGSSFFRTPDKVKRLPQQPFVKSPQDFSRIIKVLRFLTSKESVMGLFTPGTQKVIKDTVELTDSIEFDCTDVEIRTILDKHFKE